MGRPSRAALRALVTAVAVVCGLVAGGRVAWAQLEVGREAALVMRILTYDRNLAARAHGQVGVLVVYRRGDRASESARAAMVGDLQQLAQRVTVAQMRASVGDHAYSTPDGLLTAARNAHAVALYVCPGLQNETAGIANASRRAAALTITSDASQARTGLSVGVVRRSDGIGLLINLQASQAEGARLDAALLRIAEVIR
jgi:hypothetical protein